jgi:hypothetical protein
MENNNNSALQNSPIDLKRIVQKYISKWYWFALSLFVCFVVAVV